MLGILRKVRSFLVLLAAGQVGTVWEELKHQLRSESTAYGLRRDLDAEFPAPAAKVGLEVRRMMPEDEAALLAAESKASREADRELSQRRQLLKSGISTPWVAVTQDGDPCYVQWLFSPAENDRLASYFAGIFPRLAPQEALLEDAYTRERHRGLGIMPAAMARIAEEARSFGARWVITFVGKENIPSLKGCRRAGFSPYLERRVRWRFFRKSVTFSPLPPETRLPFEVG